MKKLGSPDVDDLALLQLMKRNPQMACHPYIRNEYNLMIEKYILYAKNNGNPWVCSGRQITNQLQEKLEYHYKKPCQDLQYIKNLRDNGSPDVCPFCGSLKTGTLDHYLPQADYPEWIIYSNNLVPACDCNSKRRNDVKGNNRNQRILHPYFDECLNERIVRAIFTGNFESPKIDIIPIQQYGIPSETIQFHINTVIKRTTITQWMNTKWQTMKRNPQSMICAIPKAAKSITIDQLDGYLSETLECKDDEHGTMNNWYSMFISGIISSKSAKAWLLERFNSIKDGTINPLD